MPSPLPQEDGSTAHAAGDCPAPRRSGSCLAVPPTPTAVSNSSGISRSPSSVATYQHRMRRSLPSCCSCEHLWQRTPDLKQLPLPPASAVLTAADPISARTRTFAYSVDAAPFRTSPTPCCHDLLQALSFSIHRCTSTQLFRATDCFDEFLL
uniref:(northern house mosquito) hypothetical protein n=1 Tax=Culex pipiens TaxID=7175 RepID=A0A8D8L7N6_CULPI